MTFFCACKPFINVHLQTPSALLAQAHANASTPHGQRAEREHRRERDRERAHRASRAAQQDNGASPSQPLVLTPAPAHVNKPRRTARENSGGGGGNIGSVQPLAPTRRTSGQQNTSSAALAPHPYAAAPSGNGYNSVNSGPIAPLRASTAAQQQQAQYERHSPNPSRGLGMGGNVLNGNGNGSESFLYGGQQQGSAIAVGGTAARGMGVYDQMERVGEQDEHGRKGGFWAAMCCRA
jgi:casein kinase 1